MDYPLAKDDEAAQSWPMTEAASGFCAYPSERSDPRLGAERLGATPEAASEVCEMARKYEGHMAEIGTECATEDTCGKCNGVWCKGTVTAFAQKQSVNTQMKQNESDNPPPFPLAHENETLQTWPMTDSADGFCAYPSERSDPTLGAEQLGAAPTSPEEVEKVCEMARKYEGHRAEVGSECAKESVCSGCNGVWCKGAMKSLIQASDAHTHVRENPEPFPLAHENETLQTWPMTDAADGFCAYPSERSDPTLGAEQLGAAPTSPEEVEKVCEMARKYEGHRAEVGSECAKESVCSGCNGVWCKGAMKSLIQASDAYTHVRENPEPFPLAHENETLQTWPMTDAADGFCAYPSERSDPTLGAEQLGAAPTSPEEVEKVCEMARKYEGHRAEVGSECAKESVCSGCNGVWCKGAMKSLIQASDAHTHVRENPEPFPLAHENETLQTWPMTDAADGFCAYPSERSDPTLGAEQLGAAPTSPEEVEKVCEMARKYEGHRAEVGSECAKESVCSGCNGVWCKGAMKSLIQASDAHTHVRENPEPFPLAHENETLQTWPMTNAADGFCAYPSERSDPTLGAEHLGAAPTSPKEVEKVCEMARKYEGHRAEVGSECAKESVCSGCNGVWCKGVMKS